MRCRTAAFSLILLTLLPLPSSAGWIGQTFNGTHVALWLLNPNGTLPLSPIGPPLPLPGYLPSISPGLFTCASGRYCLFVASSADGSATLYNVSSVDAHPSNSTLLIPPSAPGPRQGQRVVSLHIDASADVAYYTARLSTTLILMSLSGDGVITSVADLTPYLANMSGFSAALCVSTQLMWFAINKNGGGGSLHTVNVTRGMVQSTKFYVNTFTSLWADCGSVNVLGVSYSLSTGEVSFGSISFVAPGPFMPRASQYLPEDCEPNGVLSSAPDGNLAVPSYKSYAYPGRGTASGYVAYVNQAGITLKPVAYYLAGACAA